MRVRRRRWRRLRRSYKGLRCVSGCAATGTRTQTWTGRLDLEAGVEPWSLDEAELAPARHHPIPGHIGRSLHGAPA